VQTVKKKKKERKKKKKNNNNNKTRYIMEPRSYFPREEHGLTASLTTTEPSMLACQYTALCHVLHSSGEYVNNQATNH
jgi:hypothetical protein